jgi:xanthine dehydrogenase YagR molybdenum-binding subunit
MVFGIGAALTDEAVADTRFGYHANHDIAEYQIPVHVDAPAIDAAYLREQDDAAAPIRTMRVGELGICGRV